jgi:hypothetical protein
MEKLTFKQLIKNIINTGERGYKTRLAQVAGYAQAGGLSKVLDKEEKEFENFNSIINLVTFLWEDKEIEMMIKYSNEIDPNKKTARNFLEYFAMNRQFEQMNALVDKMEKSKNTESKEWAKLYKMIYVYEQCKTKDELINLIREVGLISVNIYELVVFKKMLMNYCYSQLCDFTVVKTLSQEIERDVKMIEDSFMKEMYTIRSSQINSYNYLRVFNNPKAAINYTDNVINSTATISFKAYAYFIKGYSYLFTSHENTVNNLLKSIELYKEQNREKDVEDLREKVEFANVYWDKFNDGKCEFIKNQILFDIKNGKDVTNELAENKDKIDLEMGLYLEGLNTNNEKKLLLSLIKYMKKNDLFLGNLAKIELLRIGYDEEILQELI